jgi:transposase
VASVTLGVDISARWFDVAYGPAVRRFANTAPGIAACLGWVAGLDRPTRIGLEAAGGSHLPLATALHEAGYPVFVCNPLSIARYAEAVLARTKPDATDARRSARFCETHALTPWRPTPPAHQRLHALVATRQALLQPLPQLRNREGAAGSTACQALVAELQAPWRRRSPPRSPASTASSPGSRPPRRPSGATCGSW